MSLDGLYLRMEAHDPTHKFSNGMRISLQGSEILFEITGKPPQKLRAVWIDTTAFEID